MGAFAIRNRRVVTPRVAFHAADERRKEPQKELKTLKLLEAEAPTSTFAKVLSLLRLHRGAEVLLLPRLELGLLGFGAPSAAFRGFRV